ncbi:hypothetical protein Tco_1288123 [Tanacetum coccineum]
MVEPKNAESTVQFDAEEYEEHQENPNQETPTEFPKSDIKQYFTFDDIPPSKWRERSIEMLTWCTAELQYYTIDVVIKRFLTRLQGRLRDWYHSLGEYRQLQIQQSISPRFYCLNGVDDVNLKQVFLNSFPKSLRNEAYRALEARNVTIAQTTLGELYQLILNALAKLYNQKKFLAEFERTGKRLGTACDDNYLGHFARNCPDKKRSQALIQALNQVELIDVSDLESLYYLDDKPSDSVLCTIAYLDFSSDDDSDTDSLESDYDFGVYMINPITHVLPIQEDPPLPLVKVYLFTDAYAKPIPIIAFFDTGSSVSILNPNILLGHYCKPHHQNFMAANKEKFVIDKISVPINIRLFPKCVIKRRLLGSSSHGKDLLIGFDILHKLPNLRWSGEGLHYRSFFNPWTAMHRLFVASITPPIFNISSIIEPTTSLWACEAFYVNKRSEQVRGKLRLVINYQPLNHFLADDKFKLPQKKSLFQHLADAKVLSKSSLPMESNAVWFKKNAPSAFQKAMITIIEPILANTLVYIDHILLFSPNEQSHAELLSKFYSLVTKYGIMLSEKNMEVGVTTIQFLGTEISDGKYQP